MVLAETRARENAEVSAVRRRDFDRVVVCRDVEVAAGVEGDAVGAVYECAREGGAVPVRVVFCDRVDAEIGQKKGVGRGERGEGEEPGGNLQGELEFHSLELAAGK